MARDLALERAWRQRMRAYEQSGLKIREFCRQEGLVDHQFTWWRAELKRRAAKSRVKDDPKATQKTVRQKTKKKHAGETKSQFLPVQIEAPLASQASVEIILDQPPRIRVIGGFDADVLREVVRLLEQS
jgi:hypothetical protein